jgi:hypothetical protein
MRAFLCPGYFFFDWHWLAYKPTVFQNDPTPLPESTHKKFGRLGGSFRNTLPYFLQSRVDAFTDRQSRK